VLQEREIRRVGGTQTVPVDVRVIAATNANLEQKIKQGTFREDLYYRLNVLPIRIPALRMVKEDLSLIAAHVITKLNQQYGREVESLSPEALKILTTYDWPGNVRELENVIGRAMIAMKPSEAMIGTEHLPVLSGERPGQSLPSSAQEPIRPLQDVVADAEKAAIERALRQTVGNREQAADLLGTAVRNLYYKIKKYGIRT
jgi:transcriptional regulator with PAS, ATPase and Fis domain